jgi:hypothetical protein
MDQAWAQRQRQSDYDQEELIQNMARLVLETREDLDDIMPANRLLWMIPAGGAIQATITETTEIYFEQPKENRGSPHAARVTALIKDFSESEVLSEDTRQFFEDLIVKLTPLWEIPTGREQLEAMYPVCRSIRTFKGDLFKLHMVLTVDAETLQPFTRLFFLRALQQMHCPRKAGRPMRSVANQRLREQLRR